MSASTWGNFQNAERRVLLIHGITASSHAWHDIALEFVSRGYAVTAPDLLGHGSAPCGSDYTIAALARHLEPYLQTSEHPYDIVVGHSLGATIAAALLPLLKSTKPVRVVLVDPSLEQSPEEIAHRKTLITAVLANPMSPEHFRNTYPALSHSGAVLSALSARLCDHAAAYAILEQNAPWSFSHLLSAVPDNVRVCVLVADLSKDAIAREAQLAGYPNVTVNTVRGASHAIAWEVPEIVVQTALRTVQ